MVIGKTTQVFPTFLPLCSSASRNGSAALQFATARIDVDSPSHTTSRPQWSTRVKHYRVFPLPPKGSATVFIAGTSQPKEVQKGLSNEAAVLISSSVRRELQYLRSRLRSEEAEGIFLQVLPEDHVQSASHVHSHVFLSVKHCQMQTTCSPAPVDGVILSLCQSIRLIQVWTPNVSKPRLMDTTRNKYLKIRWRMLVRTTDLPVPAPDPLYTKHRVLLSSRPVSER